MNKISYTAHGTPYLNEERINIGLGVVEGVSWNMYIQLKEICFLF